VKAHHSAAQFDVQFIASDDKLDDVGIFHLVSHSDGFRRHRQQTTTAGSGELRHTRILDFYDPFESPW
jgi:hypothetical protein